jgi:hypothetical protein
MVHLSLAELPAGSMHERSAWSRPRINNDYGSALDFNGHP